MAGSFRTARASWRSCRWSSGCTRVRPGRGQPKTCDLAEDRGKPRRSRTLQIGPAQVGPVQVRTVSRPRARRTISVALPVSAPDPGSRICAFAPESSSIWTKLSTSHLMEVASRPVSSSRLGQEGGYIFPRFLPAYDAVAALAHTFALLAGRRPACRDVVAGLPAGFSAHEGVVTPWEKKGLVMRSVMELGKDKPHAVGRRRQGHLQGRMGLVVPDPEEALTHIWAEAGRRRARGRGRRTMPGMYATCCVAERS